MRVSKKEKLRRMRSPRLCEMSLKPFFWSYTWWMAAVGTCGSALPLLPPLEMRLWMRTAEQRTSWGIQPGRGQRGWPSPGV